MHRSKIEWVLNPDNKTLGWVWNPITGCLNGCEYCYARKLANTRLFSTYCYNINLAPGAKGSYESGDIWVGNLTGDYTNPFFPRFWSDRCNKIGGVTSKPPKGIFVCDMSDLFGKGIPEQWTYRVLDRIREMKFNRFYLLTKQPQNLPKFSPFPSNVWLGVSATNSSMFINAIDYLSKVEAKVKYISFEPLLDWAMPPTKTMFPVLRWVIIGAQTKPYKPPNPLWVHEIIVACREAGIPYFLKDNLRKCLTVEAPFYRMPDYLIQKEGFSYRTDKPILIQDMPKA